MLVRPCLLVIDSEVTGAISSRKLVLESARFNVIATYSCEEATATLERFPLVHGIVMNAVLLGKDCASFMQQMKARFPGPVRVLVGTCEHGRACPADYFVDTYSPRALLETLYIAFPEMRREAA